MHLARQQIFWLESQGLGQHQREAAHQQARSHQQHQRKSDFGNHQHGTRQLVVTSRRGTAASFFQRFEQRRPRNLNGWGETKKYSSGQRNQDRETQYGGINGDPFRVRNSRALPGNDGVAQDVDAAVGEQNTDRRTDEREQRAFRQELPENSPPARTQRNSQCDLAFADGGAREHQVRDIGASNQQNKRHGCEEKQQARAQRADQLVVKANHADSILLVNRRVLFFQLLLNSCHFGVGLGDGHAIFQPRKNYQLVILAIELRAIKRKRLPQLEIRKCAIKRKASRQDSDDRERLFIKQNRLAQNSRIAAVAALPQTITQEDDLFMTGLFIVGRKIAADHWSDAQHAKEIPGYLRTPNSFGIAAACNREGQRARGGKFQENMIHVAPIQKFSSRGGAARDGAVRVGLPKSDDTVGIRKRQRFKQNSVHDAENYDVRANPDRQSQNGDRREARVSPQHARAITQILPKCVHNNFRPQEAPKRQPILLRRHLMSTSRANSFRAPGMLSPARQFHPRRIFVPQRDHRIHARSPSRWKVRREQCHRAEQHGDRDYRRGIPRLHAIQQAGHQSRQHEGRGNAQENSDKREAHALLDDHAAHILRTRTQGHADPDFLRAQLHGIRHQSVDSDGGQQQRDAGENHQQRHIEISALRGFRTHLIHGANMRDRQAAARGAKLFLNFRAEGKWFDLGAHDPGNWNDAIIERGHAIRHLRHGNVHDRLGIAVEAAVSHVADNSNDFARRLFEFRAHSFADRDALAHGIRVLPIFLGHALVDQDDRFRAAVVAVRKHAAAQQRNLENVKIARRERAIPGAAMRRTVGERATFDDERKTEAAFQGKAARRSKRDDAGKRLHTALRFAHQLIHRRGGFKAFAAEGHFHGENLVRREAGIHTAQRCKCADEAPPRQGEDQRRARPG